MLFTPSSSNFNDAAVPQMQKSSSVYYAANSKRTSCRFRFRLRLRLALALCFAFGAWFRRTAEAFTPPCQYSWHWVGEAKCQVASMDDKQPQVLAPSSFKGIQTDVAGAVRMDHGPRRLSIRALTPLTAW